MQNATPPRAEIEAALVRIQAWPGLARSPQLTKFLKYIVEAQLDGNESGIKAYSIAVDVFGRPPSFDPQSDPIVRVQARRLRAAIEEYYAGDGAMETVRFNLPVGRYVPDIIVRGAEREGPTEESPLPTGPGVGTGTGPPARPQRSILAQIDDIVLLVLLVSVALGIALVMTQVLGPKPLRLAVPQPPRVAISEFSSVAAGRSSGIGGLAVELVTDLNQFPFIEASYQPRLELGETGGGTEPLVLSGIARGEAGGIHVTASLKRATTDSSIWSMTQIVPGDDLTGQLDDLARGFSDQLGSVSGPLHADAVEWLNATPEIVGNESDYLCNLLFLIHRKSADPVVGERARVCVNALLQRQPQSATGLTIRGALLLEQTLQRYPDAPNALLQRVQAEQLNAGC